MGRWSTTSWPASERKERKRGRNVILIGNATYTGTQNVPLPLPPLAPSLPVSLSHSLPLSLSLPSPSPSFNHHTNLQGYTTTRTAKLLSSVLGYIPVPATVQVYSPVTPRAMLASVSIGLERDTGPDHWTGTEGTSEVQFKTTVLPSITSTRPTGVTIIPRERKGKTGGREGEREGEREREREREREKQREKRQRDRERR